MNDEVSSRVKNGEQPLERLKSTLSRRTPGRWKPVWYKMRTNEGWSSRSAGPECAGDEEQAKADADALTSAVNCIDAMIEVIDLMCKGWTCTAASQEDCYCGELEDAVAKLDKTIRGEQ